MLCHPGGERDTGTRLHPQQQVCVERGGLGSGILLPSGTHQGDRAQALAPWVPIRNETGQKQGQGLSHQILSL